MALSVSVLRRFDCKTEKIWYFDSFWESVKAMYITLTSQGHPIDLFLKISVLFGQICAGWEICPWGKSVSGK